MTKSTFGTAENITVSQVKKKEAATFFKKCKLKCSEGVLDLLHAISTSDLFCKKIK